jgi:hypothetical protein
VGTSWIPLLSQADLDQLMLSCGGFHDGCFREAHVWTESFVDADMRMSVASDLDTRVRLLIQRQWKDPSAIELLFEHVTTFHLQPSPEKYDSIIFGAAMLCRDGVFYWAEDADWSPESSKRDDVTWVAAKKLSWRDVSEWMGPDLHYGRGGAEI